MAYETDATTEAGIASGRIKAADLVDFYVKDAGTGSPLVLRAWTWPGSASFPGTVSLDGSTAANTYETLYGRITIPKGIRMAASLASEPLEISLDGSRSGDPTDWVGKFVASNWHQGKVRVRQVMLNFDTEALGAVPMWEWRGRLDHRELVIQPDQPQIWRVTCQGGLFRIRGRRLKTRSHADQQLRRAGDTFYLGTANMVGRPLNWAKAVGNIPGRATGSATPAPTLGSSPGTIATRYGSTLF